MNITNSGENINHQYFNISAMKNYFILLTMLTLLPSCVSQSQKSTDAFLNDKNNIYQVLYYASLAGSSHNSQPWKTEVFGEDSILVFADTTRKLAVVDSTSRELYISVGAFIENLRLAASCYGYETNIKIHAIQAVPPAPWRP